VCPDWILTETTVHANDRYSADGNNDDEEREDSGGASGSESNSDLELDDEPDDSVGGGNGGGKSRSVRNSGLSGSKRPKAKRVLIVELSGTKLRTWRCLLLGGISENQNSDVVMQSS
jgi:hypothetical protein